MAVSLIRSNSLSRHIFEYDKIIIGGSLESLLYSYFTGYPILITEFNDQFPYQFFKQGINLSKLYMNNTLNWFKSPDGHVLKGVSKQEVWYKIFGILSVAGKVILGHSAEYASIRDGKLRVIGKFNQKMIIEYNELMIFDDYQISFGLPQPKKTISQDFLVYDWIDVSSGRVHPYDYIKTKDKFVKEIFFIPIKKNPHSDDYIKNVLSISYLSKNKLSKMNYDETHTTFKVYDLMKQAGIRGRKNGKYGKYRKQRYYDIKLIPDGREILDKTLNIYDNTDKLKFFYETPESIIKQFQNTKSPHWRIAEQIYVRYSKSPTTRDRSGQRLKERTRLSFDRHCAGAWLEYEL